MNVETFDSAQAANAAAADVFAAAVRSGAVNVMLAAGNTPLELYRLIATRRLPLGGLRVFALDEYVGVPREEPRNCANLIRRTAIEPWGVPADRYFTVSSLLGDALASVGLLHYASLRSAEWVIALPVPS